MASVNDWVAQVFFILLGVFGLAVVVWGIMYFVGPREQVEGQEARPEQEELAGVEDLAHLRENGLRLSNFAYDSQARAIEGTVENRHDQPFVNVQVAFDLLNADSTLVTTVRDTVGEVRAGRLWEFSIPVPADTEVAEVVPSELSAYLRDVSGLQRESRIEFHEVEPRPNE